MPPKKNEICTAFLAVCLVLGFIIFIIVLRRLLWCILHNQCKIRKNIYRSDVQVTVRRYLVNFTGAAGIVNATVYKTEPFFTDPGHGRLSFLTLITVLSIVLRVSSVAFEPSYQCPDASEVALKGILGSMASHWRVIVGLSQSSPAVGWWNPLHAWLVSVNRIGCACCLNRRYRYGARGMHYHILLRQCNQNYNVYNSVVRNTFSRCHKDACVHISTGNP